MQKIPTEQVLKRLAVENPWWTSPFQVQEVRKNEPGGSSPDDANLCAVSHPIP